MKNFEVRVLRWSAGVAGLLEAVLPCVLLASASCRGKLVVGEAGVGLPMLRVVLSRCF